MTLTQFQRDYIKRHAHVADDIYDEEGNPAIGASDGNLVVLIDGGGATITTGIKHDIPLPFAGEIYAWELLADQSGSIQIDIWKDTYANFPPTNADSIVGGGEPAISADNKNQVADDAVSWPFSAGDILRINVDSVTSIQRATLALKYRRS